jgi:hypothetical protein
MTALEQGDRGDSRDHKGDDRVEGEPPADRGGMQSIADHRNRGEQEQCRPRIPADRTAAWTQQQTGDGVDHDVAVHGQRPQPRQLD